MLFRSVHFSWLWYNGISISNTQVDGRQNSVEMFQFTPLLGAQSDSRAHSSLLELDNGIKILVDVGWDEKFDVSMLNEIER